MAALTGHLICVNPSAYVINLHTAAGGLARAPSPASICQGDPMLRFTQRCAPVGRPLFRRAAHLIATFAAAATIALPASATRAAPPRGGPANIAMIGEPQTLDPM